MSVFRFPVAGPNGEPGAAFVKLATLTWKQAEAYVADGAEMLKQAQSDTPPDSRMWLERVGQVVVDSLNRAARSGIVPDATEIKDLVLADVKEHYSLREIRAMHDRILEESGLKAVSAGESAAA